MGGQKFEYDESGSTFFYFLLSFLALVLIPATFYYWPRKRKEGIHLFIITFNFMKSLKKLTINMNSSNFLRNLCNFVTPSYIRQPLKLASGMS